DQFSRANDARNCGSYVLFFYDFVEPTRNFWTTGHFIHLEIGHMCLIKPPLPFLREFNPSCGRRDISREDKKIRIALSAGVYICFKFLQHQKPPLDDFHYAREIIGEHVQCDFGGDLRQAKPPRRMPRRALETTQTFL